MGKKQREVFHDEIVEMYTVKKLGQTTIAGLLKINRRDVKEVLKQNNLYTPSRKHITEDDVELIAQLIRLYTEEKKTLEQIREITGITPKQTRRIFKERGVVFKTAKDYNRKYTSDSFAFKEYTPESVYWAGFIAGDGCIFSHGLANKQNNTVNVSLAYKDKEHLTKLKKFLKYNGILYESADLTKITLNVNNADLVNDLAEKYRIVNNKTDTYAPPGNIPDHLIKYFILGLIDADGSFGKIKRPNKAKRRHYNGDYIYYIGLTGTMETCEYVKSFFGSDVKPTKRNKNSTNNYTVLFQGNKQLINYGLKLYDEDSIAFCLQRKYKSFCELLEQYSVSRP